MSKHELTVTLPSDREVQMTRVFEAPRALVFEAHSKCEHVTQWWARGNKMACEMDFRPGGRWRFVEHAPDGEDYAFRGEYREIVAPEKLSWTFEFEGMPGNVLVETLSFEEHDGKTTVTSVSRYESKEARDGMIASGMEVGAAESYNHLDELLARLTQA